MTTVISESEMLQVPAGQYLASEALAAVWAKNTQAIDIEWPTGWEYTQIAAQRDELQQAFMEEGRSPEASLRKANSTFADSFEPILKRARQELEKHEMDHVAEKSDAELGEWLVQHTKDFVEVAELRVIELQEAKENFIEKMEWAIDHQGLPLTKEQLHARLEDVELGFFDPLSEDDTTLVGKFSVVSGVVSVSIELSGKGVEATVYHELFHALGGNHYLADPNHKDKVHIKKIGLEPGGRPRPVKPPAGEESKFVVDTNDRLWLNEAVTDLMANILTDKQRQNYQFDDPTRSLADAGVHLLGVMRRLPDCDKPIYADYKHAALAGLRSIPAGTLLRAYFAANHDPFEVDQLAAAHAERELQRAIKSAGGQQRLASLRLVDRLFQEDRGERAVAMARLIHKKDLMMTDIDRAARHQATLKHTADYQAQIARAKAYLAERQQAA